MSRSMLRVLAAAAMAASSAAGNCSNPVFSQRLFFAPNLELVVGSPQPHPVAATGQAEFPCSAFANQDSCCTNQTLEQIQYYFEMGDSLLNATGMLIQNNDYPAKLEAVVTAQLNLVCSSINEKLFPNLATHCSSATALATKYTHEMTQAAQDVVEAELKCAQGLAKYLKGVLCFACEADWNQYLVHDAQLAITGLNINQDTCTALVDDCAPVNDAVIRLATAAVDFADAVLNGLSGDIWPVPDINLDSLVRDLPDSCGGTMGSPGNCEDFYCATGVVSGLGTPLQSNWGWPTAASTNTMSGASTMPQARALAAVAAASSTVNVYTSTGYKAYEIGNADVKADGLQGWAVALIVVAVVVVVGTVVGVVVVRQRRGTSRSVSYSTTTPVVTTEAVHGDSAYGSFNAVGN